MQTRETQPFPYHPAYGLPDDTRLTILAYADKHSVRDAALVYRVSASCIYRWRNDLCEADNN